MKIAIASLGDPRAVKTWSGIPYSIVKALENKGHEVVGINLHYPPSSLYQRLLKAFYWHVHKRWFFSMFEKETLLHVGQQLDLSVKRLKPDVVLVIKSDYLAYTTFSEPAITIHDATFILLVDYYDTIRDVCKRTLKAGNIMYKKAMNKAAAAVFSADWASQSAIRDYGAFPDKVFTIPFGANMRECPGIDEVKSWVIARKESALCDFLFLGVDWQRKGGPDALRIVVELNRLGVKAKLTVVGCQPDIPEEFRPYVHLIGFLNKENPEDYKKFVNIMAQSTALLLPSLAECYGCVFCEANAFGLPVLGRNTGGIPEIIKDGINGLLFERYETPETFALRWKQIWQDKSQYESMAIKARVEYDDRLNYDVFVSRLEGLMNNIAVSNKALIKG